MSWRQISLKYVARFAYGDTLPRADDGAEGRVQVFGSNGPYATFSRANTRSPAVVIGRKGSYGKVNWTKEACFASDTTFFVDETTTQQYLRWLFYVFQTLNLDKGTDEAAVPGLNRDDAYERKIPLPPLPEQRAIADYLDRETSKIDALITEKERLLSLLAEKRRALITQAVTRGLNPGAPMRDSGVEWLGEIPRRWGVERLRYLASEPLMYGANEAALETDPSFPRFVRITDISEDGSLRSETFKSLPSEIAEPYLLREGDVLLARSGATVGKTFIYRKEWGKACFAGYLIRLRCNRDLLLPDFLFAFTQSHIYWSQIRGGTIQATIQNFSAEKYGGILLPLPPPTEQHSIVVYLDGETAKIDELSSTVKKNVKLLQERRAALISAAVTGQIHV